MLTTEIVVGTRLVIVVRSPEMVLTTVVGTKEVLTIVVGIKTVSKLRKV